jgi:hypothetical protein
VVSRSSASLPAPTQRRERRGRRQYHWHQIIVVSGTPQTTRARIRFDRCYHGTLLFDPADPAGVASWIHNVVYEWAALIKAETIQRGC